MLGRADSKACLGRWMVVERTRTGWRMEKKTLTGLRAGYIVTLAGRSAKAVGAGLGSVRAEPAVR